MRGRAWCGPSPGTLERVRRAALLCLLALAGCGGDDDAGSDSGLKVRTVATGLDTPWAIAWLPDGRALVTERPGRVRLLSAAGKLQAEPVGEVDVVESDGSESGLLGIAIDPDFADNGFVYLYRTTENGNEVARYRFAGDRLTEDGVVVDGIRAGPIHNGGRLAFGPDERLYITTGETGDSALAQADGLNGKVLRTTRYRADGVRPEVFTTGHRNVQGIDWEPGTDRLLITELGPDSDDEVNVLREGANYGWPDGGGESALLDLPGRDRAVGRDVRLAPRLVVAGRLRVREPRRRAAAPALLRRRAPVAQRAAARGRVRPPARRRRGPRRRPLRADEQPRRPRRPGGRRRPHPPVHAALPASAGRPGRARRAARRGRDRDAPRTQPGRGRRANASSSDLPPSSPTPTISAITPARTTIGGTRARSASRGCFHAFEPSTSPAPTR